DLLRFQSQATGNSRDGPISIMFIGRLESRKGVSVLLEAFRRIRNDDLPVQLVIAGDGPERPKLEEFVQENAIEDVTFLGRVDDAEVSGLMAYCDIFCAPSLYGESFGIVLAEAMASGKPVVAAANAGYRTVLTGEAARFLVRPGDVEDLRQALSNLAQDAS